HRVGASQRGDPSLGDGGEMIRRSCPQLRGQLRSAARLQLIGVQLQPQAVSACRVQYRACLFESEHTGFTEHVRESRELFTRNDWDLFAQQLPDVLATPVLTVTILARDFVRAQPGGHQAKT